MPGAAAPVRVVFVTVFGTRLGGSDRILWTFLRHLDRSRIEPGVVFLEDGRFRAEVADLGIWTEVVDSGRLRNAVRMAATVTRLSQLLRQARPDLVVGWLSTAQLYAAPAAMLAGLADRCCWSQLDMPGARPLSREGLIERLATRLPARGIGACSEAIAVAQRRLRPPRPTFAVLPGIESPEAISGERLVTLKAELGIPPQRAVVGIVGRLVPWKGQDRLLRAVALLRDEGRDVHALVVGGAGHGGDAAYERGLPVLAARLGLGEAVTFTGEVPDAGAHIQLMDTLVNASTPEPFGLVLLEAMALGVPVVAVDAGGPREIVEPGRSGLLVPTGEPQDLADSVRPLLDDPTLRRAVAVRARARFAARFTAERMAGELTDRFAELASAPTTVG